MACRAVCISRAEGAGGGETAQLVAERLGFRYIDDEIIAQAAAKGGITPGDVADEEKRKSAMSRIVREFGRATVPDSYGIAGMSRRPYEEISSEAVRGLIQDAIEETADRGDVVIVSHGASFTLSGRPNVLRVLLTASPETRMGRLSESQGLDPKDARKAIKKADAARSDYLRRFYGVETELPTHYDLVVNTDVLSLEQAAELIAQGAS
jgi:cytidylate kinase